MKRQPTRGPSRTALAAASPGVGVVLVGALLALWTPSDDGLVLCPVRLCTGVACPGCGLTRATSRLLRGDLSSAFAFHPLVLFAVLEVVAALVFLQLLRAGRVRFDARLLNVVLVANGVLFAVVWAVRAVNGSLPT
ncbi:MAG: DUF2752 domain-containing protein [Acidimicrobiia bacterium]|nr:DUF2752 domain-containing protein [Acidimicrobiia bacterium]